MREFLHKIRQVYDGTRTIDNRKKYQVIEIILGLVHVVFAYEFFRYELLPMAIYNVAIVLYYLVMAILLGKVKNYVAIIISTFFEILIHSMGVTVLVGFEWGFMIYIITLIPVVFYITYTVPAFKQNITIATIAAGTVSVVYLAIRVYMNLTDPVYPELEYVEGVTWMHYFNTSIALIFLWGVSMMFSIEVRYMRHGLEMENDNLNSMANIDPLTKLYNRRGMNEHLKNAMAKAEEEGEPFCLIMGDIDDFKVFNDTYGHALGDVVLMQVAEVLKDKVRENDCVCRWGGEEMLVLIRADIEIAEIVANRFLAGLKACPIMHEDEELHVSMTFGIAEYQPGLTIRTMVDIADDKLYYGKMHGKNQVVARVMHMTQELTMRKERGRKYFE